MEINFVFSLFDMLCGLFLGSGAWCLLFISASKGKLSPRWTNFLSNYTRWCGLLSFVYLLAFMLRLDNVAWGYLAFSLMNFSALVAWFILKLCGGLSKREQSDSEDFKKARTNYRMCLVMYLLFSLSSVIIFFSFIRGNAVFYENEDKVVLSEVLPNMKCGVIGNNFYVAFKEQEGGTAKKISEKEYLSISNLLCKIGKFSENTRSDVSMRRRITQNLVGRLQEIMDSQEPIKKLSKQEMDDFLRD